MIKRMVNRNRRMLLPVLSAIVLFTCVAGAQTAAKPSDVLVIDAATQPTQN